jgi:2-C-methyl-D-erythritol 4-phosphate cytidylyltransferase
MICGGVIPAAGRARRFGVEDKTLIEIAGRPLLAWTIDALIDAEALAELVIVVNEDNEHEVQQLLQDQRPSIPVTTTRGGAARMDSVRAGVEALQPRCDLVLIHDAARPLVTSDLVRSVVEAGASSGAAIAAAPVTDTIKRVDGEFVQETLDRSTLVAVQTPQVFRRDWLQAAYEVWPSDRDATDEASILEQAGFTVRTVTGTAENFKVTTGIDAIIAEARLRERASTS